MGENNSMNAFTTPGLARVRVASLGCYQSCSIRRLSNDLLVKTQMFSCDMEGLEFRNVSYSAHPSQR